LNNKEDTMRGSCCCGAIAYEIDPPLEQIMHCHCKTCQKVQGAAFASVAFIPHERFRWIHGQEMLSDYESSPGKRRYFCPRCGSHLLAIRQGQPHVILRVSSLDDDPQPGEQAHIWTSHDRPWLNYSADLPSFPEFQPAD